VTRRGISGRKGVLEGFDGAWLRLFENGFNGGAAISGVAASASFLAPLSAPGVPLPFSFPNMLNL
jgi:hypothetical protein